MPMVMPLIAVPGSRRRGAISEFQDSMGYKEKPCIEKLKKPS